MAARYPCTICGMQFADARIAEQCAAWCKQHKSCNLEIIRHAVQE